MLVLMPWRLAALFLSSLLVCATPPPPLPSPATGRHTYMRRTLRNKGNPAMMPDFVVYFGLVALHVSGLVALDIRTWHGVWLIMDSGSHTCGQHFTGARGHSRQVAVHGSISAPALIALCSF